ncbi:hypothetical protein ABZ470_00690 [Streptosporangium sp. NPDC020072]|uniref:hypothetical protein n=1 Tax=Streptosporangium sp. NPDC020072 TaxID=3154788 RepID=UPI0034201A4B
MTTLRITVTDVTDDQYGAVVQALRDAGLPPSQWSVRTQAEVTPSGPAMWLALALFAMAVAMLLAWIWAGEWRWGATAVFPLLAGVISLGASLSRGNPKRK